MSKDNSETGFPPNYPVSLNTLTLIHLMRHGKITSMEAIELYGNTRLSSSVYELRSQGYPIETTLVDGYNRFGQPTRYAVYSLPKNWKSRFKTLGLSCREENQ